MPVEIRIINLANVRKHMSAATFNKRARKGFEWAGLIVEAEAKSIVQPHHFTGRFERGIHHHTYGDTLGTLHTKIGVRVTTAPEARPLTYGWESRGGRMPNIDAIATWVSKKMGERFSSGVHVSARGFRYFSRKASVVSQESRVKGIAFVIARQIRRIGFTFGSGSGGQKLDTFTAAFDNRRQDIKRQIARALAGHGTF